MKRNVLSLLVITATFGTLFLCGCKRHNKSLEAKMEVQDSGKVYMEPHSEGFAILSGGEFAYYPYDNNKKEILKLEFKYPYSMFSLDGKLYVTGENNMYVVVSDDSRQEYGTYKGTDMLGKCVKFKNMYYALGNDGIVYSADFKKWKKTNIELKDDIYDIAASKRCCIVISGHGDIYYINDNESDWNYMNYNDTYGSAYSLKGIYQTENMLYVYGYDNRLNESIVMDTVGGGVWTTRRFTSFSDNPDYNVSELVINDIVINDGQIIGAACNGMLAILPECIECNVLKEKGTNNWAKISANDNYIGLLDADGGVNIFDYDGIRQNTISAATAYQEYMNGASIVDVRSWNEHEEWHINGDVNIPLDNLCEEISKIYPDKDTLIIFYCSAGVRSARAVEQAKELGYENVYSIKDINEWQW